MNQPPHTKILTSPIRLGSHKQIQAVRDRSVDLPNLSYTIVVGLLALVFAAGVAWMPSTLGIEDDALLVAASTLVVSALFNRLLKRVQHHVDRRFNRSAYQVDEIQEQVFARLHGSLDVDELSKLWIQTTTESLQPEAAGIWLNPKYTAPHRP